MKKMKKEEQKKAEPPATAATEPKPEAEPPKEAAKEPEKPQAAAPPPKPEPKTEPPTPKSAMRKLGTVAVSEADRQAAERQLAERQQRQIAAELQRRQQFSDAMYGYAAYRSANGPPMGYEQRPASRAEYGIEYGTGLYRPESRVAAQPPVAEIYKPVQRYNSYSTLPRPEQLDAESIYGRQPMVPQPADFYGTVGVDPHRPASKMSRYGVAEPPKVTLQPIDWEFQFRPASAMSGMMATGFAVDGVPFAPHFPVVPMEPYFKEIVNWPGLNLASYMHILCGFGFFIIGMSRMFLRADYAKGQEIFYGLSVICAGLFGHLAARHSSHTLAVASYVHSLVNALLAAIPMASAILPMLPILSTTKNIDNVFLQRNSLNEPLEVDLALMIITLLEFGVAIFVASYGCRAAGATMRYVEGLRVENAKNANEKAAAVP